MGSSESKLVSAPINPEPAIKNNRLADLMDPRSPSIEIDRTPIQVDGPVPKTKCPLAFTDPRSPTIGVSRTPVREAMRATVGSFARRLGMFLHSETENKFNEAPKKCFNETVEEVVSAEGEELASTESLLPPQPSHNLASLAEHANLATAVQPPLKNVGDSSPFVLFDKPQFEVELETEADISLEEGEEARESPLHKRLSMSLITYHEGETSSQIFAEVHHDSASSPVPVADVEPLEDSVEHSYVQPSVTVEPETPVEPSLPSDSDGSPAQVSPAQSEEAEPSSEETKELLEESSLPSTPEPPSVPSPEQPQLSTGIRCPTFDPKSPSQVVFKPQWLGKGFGTTGLRARGVQGGKGGSSPLAVRMAVRKVTNENKRRSGKLKQKGTEGRSPLQILKGTNSPREQRPQAKLKVSTPDKQRLGQIDRRVLAVSLDKENR